MDDGFAPTAPLTLENLPSHHIACAKGDDHRTTNRTGWVVQYKSHVGWLSLEPIYNTRAEAVAALSVMPEGVVEHRIWEDVSTPIPRPHY